MQAARPDHPLPFTDQRFDRAELERAQLAVLNGLLARARALSPFHRRRLPAAPLESLDQLADIPFMRPDDLRAQEDVLLVPAQQVARMVSLPTSGTSGEPKRIAFTEEDVRQTRAFFASGLHCICRAGELTAVLFPSTTPGSMGSLICASVEDTGALAVPIDISRGLGEMAAALADAGATSAVGSGHALLALARHAEARGCGGMLERVLVSSDNASRSMVAAIARGLGCEVFEHYGMTETGFGCAVDCRAHAGMHIREHDMIVEIVDPDTGAVLPEGSRGEVVVTTLLREAMPVIRYRTGDISRIVPGACPCGGSLRRLDRVRGHALAGDGDWRLEEALDEAVYSLPGVMDYEALLERDAACGEATLTVELQAFGHHGAVPDAPTLAELIAPAIGEHLVVRQVVKPVEEGARLANPKLGRLHIG